MFASVVSSGIAIAQTEILTFDDLPSSGGSLYLYGDQVQGTLQNWYNQVGNLFPNDSATVGPGVEFEFDMQEFGITWTVSADVGQDTVTINQKFYGNYQGSLIGTADLALTLDGFGMNRTPSILTAVVVSQDSNGGPEIALLSHDAHSITFKLYGFTGYGGYPFNYSETTVVQLTAIPEPSVPALLWSLGLGAVIYRVRVFVPSRSEDRDTTQRLWLQSKAPKDS